MKDYSEKIKEKIQSITNYINSYSDRLTYTETKDLESKIQQLSMYLDYVNKVNDLNHYYQQRENAKTPVDIELADSQLEAFYDMNKKYFSSEFVKDIERINSSYYKELIIDFPVSFKKYDDFRKNLAPGLSASQLADIEAAKKESLERERLQAEAEERIRAEQAAKEAEAARIKKEAEEREKAEQVKKEKEAARLAALSTEVRYIEELEKSLSSVDKRLEDDSLSLSAKAELETQQQQLSMYLEFVSKVKALNSYYQRRREATSRSDIEIEEQRMDSFYNANRKYFTSEFRNNISSINPSFFRILESTYPVNIVDPMSFREKLRKEEREAERLAERTSSLKGASADNSQEDNKSVNNQGRVEPVQQLNDSDEYEGQITIDDYLSSLDETKKASKPNAVAEGILEDAKPIVLENNGSLEGKETEEERMDRELQEALEDLRNSSVINERQERDFDASELTSEQQKMLAKMQQLSQDADKSQSDVQTQGEQASQSSDQDAFSEVKDIKHISIDELQNILNDENVDLSKYGDIDNNGYPWAVTRDDIQEELNRRNPILTGEAPVKSDFQELDGLGLAGLYGNGTPISIKDEQKSNLSDDIQIGGYTATMEPTVDFSQFTIDDQNVASVSGAVNDETSSLNEQKNVDNSSDFSMRPPDFIHKTSIEELLNEELESLLENKDADLSKYIVSDDNPVAVTRDDIKQELERRNSKSKGNEEPSDVQTQGEPKPIEDQDDDLNEKLRLIDDLSIDELQNILKDEDFDSSNTNIYKFDDFMPAGMIRRVNKEDIKQELERRNAILAGRAPSDVQNQSEPTSSSAQDDISKETRIDIKDLSDEELQALLDSDDSELSKYVDNSNIDFGAQPVYKVNIKREIQRRNSIAKGQSQSSNTPRYSLENKLKLSEEDVAKLNEALGFTKSAPVQEEKPESLTPEEISDTAKDVRNNIMADGYINPFDRSNNNSDSSKTSAEGSIFPEFNKSIGEEIENRRAMISTGNYVNPDIERNVDLSNVQAAVSNSFDKDSNFELRKDIESLRIFTEKLFTPSSTDKDIANAIKDIAKRNADNLDFYKQSLAILPALIKYASPEIKSNPEYVGLLVELIESGDDKAKEFYTEAIPFVDQDVYTSELEKYNLSQGKSTQKSTIDLRTLSNDELHELMLKFNQDYARNMPGYTINGKQAYVRDCKKLLDRLDLRELSINELDFVYALYVLEDDDAIVEDYVLNGKPATKGDVYKVRSDKEREALAANNTGSVDLRVIAESKGKINSIMMNYNGQNIDDVIPGYTIEGRDATWRDLEEVRKTIGLPATIGFATAINEANKAKTQDSSKSQSSDRVVDIYALSSEELRSLMWKLSDPNSPDKIDINSDEPILGYVIAGTPATWKDITDTFQKKNDEKFQKETSERLIKNGSQEIVDKIFDGVIIDESERSQSSNKKFLNNVEKSKISITSGFNQILEKNKGKILPSILPGIGNLVGHASSVLNSRYFAGRKVRSNYNTIIWNLTGMSMDNGFEIKLLHYLNKEGKELPISDEYLVFKPLIDSKVEELVQEQNRELIERKLYNWFVSDEPGTLCLEKLDNLTAYGPAKLETKEELSRIIDDRVRDAIKEEFNRVSDLFYDKYGIKVDFYEMDSKEIEQTIEEVKNQYIQEYYEHIHSRLTKDIAHKYRLFNELKELLREEKDDAKKAMLIEKLDFASKNSTNMISVLYAVKGELGIGYTKLGEDSDKIRFNELLFDDKNDTKIKELNDDIRRLIETSGNDSEILDLFGQKETLLAYADKYVTLETPDEIDAKEVYKELSEKLPELQARAKSR